MERGYLTSERGQKVCGGGDGHGILMPYVSSLKLNLRVGSRIHSSTLQARNDYIVAQLN